MAALSEWLQLMLAEIARKRDDLDLARAEEAKRAAETQPTSPPTSQQARAVNG
jgi:F0F1-type ATP synthase epsilon subunit